MDLIGVFLLKKPSKYLIRSAFVNATLNALIPKLWRNFIPNAKNSLNKSLLLP